MGLERIIDPKERERAHAEVGYVDFYSAAVQQSEAFRKEYDGYMNVVKSAQMPLERSPDGLLKHIIHEQMNTKEISHGYHQNYMNILGLISQLIGIKILRLTVSALAKLKKHIYHCSV